MAKDKRLTKKQILCAVGEDLADIAARLFTPKPWPHQWDWNVMSGGNATYKCWHCEKKDKKEYRHLSRDEAKKDLYKRYKRSSCTSPDLIDINDWNEAIRLRIITVKRNPDIKNFDIGSGDSKELIRACCLSMFKVNKKKENQNE